MGQAHCILNEPILYQFPTLSSSTEFQDIFIVFFQKENNNSLCTSRQLIGHETKSNKANSNASTRGRRITQNHVRYGSRPTHLSLHKINQRPQLRLRASLYINKTLISSSSSHRVSSLSTCRYFHKAKGKRSRPLVLDHDDLIVFVVIGYR